MGSKVTFLIFGIGMALILITLELIDGLKDRLMVLFFICGYLGLGIFINEMTNQMNDEVERFKKKNRFK